MKDLSYAITSTLLLILAMLLVNIIWGAEINAWMETGLRDAKIKDAFFLGLALLFFHSIARPPTPKPPTK